MLALVALEATEFGTTHQSELNLADSLPPSHRLRDRSAHDCQSGGNWHWFINDTHLGTGLFGLLHVEAKAEMVCRLHSVHHVSDAKSICRRRKGEDSATIKLKFHHADQHILRVHRQA